MSIPRSCPPIAALTLTLLASPALSQEGAQAVEEIFVLGMREQRTSKGATGLDLTVAETPQAITIIDRDWMDAFGVTSLNDALRLAPGVQVEEWETNRTNYTARGFDVRNTQVDGVGMPNNWGIVTGAVDAYAFEKIEVIRGANGLLTGVGNAAGTINYVRKRPTNTAQGHAALYYGDFDRARVEADYSTPLTASGSWAGRLVAAGEKSGSYLRGLNNDRHLIYGVVDGQVGRDGSVAVGLQYQRTNTQGNMWGALNFSGRDGTQAEYDVSASTAVDWTNWDTETHTAFAEYVHALSSDWQVRASYNFRDYADDNYLFYTYAPEGLDPLTGEGLIGWPGSWPTRDWAHLVDLNLSGQFDAWGMSHQAVLGASYGYSKNNQYTRPSDPSEPAWGALPGFPYAGDAIPEPTWGPIALDETTEQRLERLFGALQLNWSAALSSIVGFNYATYKREGSGFDAQTERELSPYVSLSYRLNEQINFYGSYSDIYQPQDMQDRNGEYLPPSQGVNYELGVKSQWFDSQLLVTLAWFKAEQRDLGTFDTIIDNQWTYRGEDVAADGFELEFAGTVGGHTQLSLGLTTLELEDPVGDDIYLWVPRDTATLSISHEPPALPELRLGLNARWQSEIGKRDDYTQLLVRQGGYGLLGAFVSWEFASGIELAINAGNLTDKKYIGSLYEVGYYGAPRTLTAELSYRF